MILKLDPKQLRHSARQIRNAWRLDVSLKRKINYAKIVLSSRLGLARSFGKPTLLTIEPTNACDQKCPVCETGAGILGRDKAFMSLDRFRAILDQFDDTLATLFFYFMGETFLHKQAYEMIRIAADRGIHVIACTDGNFIDPEALVHSGIGEISFQIGGMTQETHEVYRVGGTLQTTLDALEETIRLRNAPDCTNKSMRIIAGLILMKQCEHEADRFEDYCRRIGVDRCDLIGPCVRDMEQAEAFLPENPDYIIYDEAELAKGHLVPKLRPNNYCGWIYSSATILVNGDLVSCCRDPKGTNVLGNLFEQPFDKIWNNQKYRKLRRQVSTASNQMELCRLCPGENEAPLAPVSGDNNDCA